MPFYTGQIELFAGNFVPRDFLPCDGRTLKTADYPDLFGAIGNAYGGDGTTDFALPDLGARTAIGAGQGPMLTDRPLGSRGGQASVALEPGHVPPHTHSLQASTGFAHLPNTFVLAAAPIYQQGDKNPLVAMAPNTIAQTPSAATTPHDNRQPYLPMTYMICVQGSTP